MINLHINYKNRIERVRELLHKHHLDAALISSVPNITYLTGYSNFSHEEREAFLIVTEEKQYIFTDGRYAESIRQQMPNWELILITADNSFETAFSTIVKLNKIKAVGIEEENISIKEEKHIKTAFKKLHNFNISSLRIQKDTTEISAIKEACKIGDLAFQHVLKTISEDITEKELAFELELFIKRKNAELSFPSIVAFGPGSAIPHYATSNTQHLNPNTIILLDFGVKYNNYCSDMTRTIFFGKTPEEFKKMYETVRIAQEKAISLLISNFQTPISNESSNDKSAEKVVIASQIDNVARDYIVSQGFPSIPHSLGHGIGLEVHESPRLSPNSKDELKEEMVFSIEPGIYIPGFGGVRIEDLVTIQNGQVELLTHAPKELIEL